MIIVDDSARSIIPLWPEVIERHPQPQLWLNFQNFLAAEIGESAAASVAGAV